MEEMKTVYLKPNGERRVLSPHPWVFLSDIDYASAACSAGDVVSIHSKRGGFLARGVYNPHSQIALRVLTPNDEPVDEAFIRRRVRRALDYRRSFADLSSCRLIHAESDGLPAVIADCYGSVISLQCLSLGMSRMQDMIVRALVDELSPAGVYERNDVPVRKLEGMEEKTGLLYGEVPDRVEMLENGVRFLVDVKKGQKTGYFLDQKENRAAIRPFVGGASVLDCFSHTGSFALHAASYGARQVLGVDISQRACDCAGENAALNGFAQARFLTLNAFDFLNAEAGRRNLYDVVILDPPAFAKTRANLPSARSGYKEINLRAMKILRDGGFLVTCSCSQHVPSDMFLDIILDAARDCHVQLLQSEFRSQGRDHPVLPGAAETHYLKCAIFRVDK